MIKIGCNWSSALRKLIDNNAIEIDYIKAGAYGDFNEQFDTMRKTHPILLHGLGYFAHTGMLNINDVDFTLANDHIKKCDSPHYGLHLAIKKSNMYGGITNEDIYKRMCDNIQIFKDNLSVPLLLENVPDTPEDRTVFDHYPYVLPEQINRLIKNNDVSLLLDLTHAKLTAQYNRWDIHEYISELPLDRVKEIHVNGSGYDEYRDISDTHESMKEQDYELLEWVLTLTNPSIVTLEYVGIKGESEEQVQRSLIKQLKSIKHIVSG